MKIGFIALSMVLVASVDEIPSGPDAGAKVPPLNVVAAVGEGLGETVNVVADRGGKPTIYAFVRADQWDRPMARLVKTLDDALVRGVKVANNASIVAVWITETPENAREYLPLAQQSLMLQKTRWAVFEGGKNGPEGWLLNDAAGLTVVVAREGTVLISAGFTSWNESDARPILRAFNSSSEQLDTKRH